MNKQEAIEKIKNIETLNINDNIAGQKVDMVIKNQVLDIVSKIDEQQKPKVPQVAVEFYEKYKADMLSLDEWFSDFYSNEAIEDFPRMEELTDWLHDNDNDTNRQRELALATLIVNGANAVEIEQEKLYTVEIPDPHGMYKIRYLFRNSVGNIRIGGNDYRNTFFNMETRLTESEIKQDFEWAWDAGFAKEVEEK